MPNDFAPGPAAAVCAPLFAGATLLDAEKLDAYRVALEFQAVACQLVPKRGYSELRDQLERASISIVLNTAEGCGRTRRPPIRRRFAPTERAETLFREEGGKRASEQSSFEAGRCWHGEGVSMGFRVRSRDRRRCLDASRDAGGRQWERRRRGRSRARAVG